MIDIHTHILPGFDDGPLSIDESIEMVELAGEAGITALIATPHSARLVGRAYGEEDVRAAVDSLQQTLQERGSTVKIYPGIEVHISPDLSLELQTRQAFTLAGSRYLLLELPFSVYPLFVDQVVIDLRARGIVPILAHPERLEYFQDNPNLMGQLIRLGALSQLTADSLLGNFGAKTRSMSRIMIEHGLCHFIASDAHDSRCRTPTLMDAREVAAKWVGEATADALVRANPQAILCNEKILAGEPRQCLASPPHWFWKALDER